MTTPKQMTDYVFENGLEMDFMTSIMNHKGNFSIAEITDRKYVKFPEGYNLNSRSLRINVPITDDDVLTALYNKLYVSSFISRFNDDYRVHFLVHQYPKSMKEKFEEEITGEVIHYMVLQTVLALRLDSKEKIDEYIGGNQDVQTT